MGDPKLDVFSAAPDCILVVDDDGRIVMANDACTKTLGYTPDELVGMTVEQLIPRRYRDAHRSRREEFDSEREPRTMGERGQRLRALTKDGEERFVEIGLNRAPVDGKMRVIAVVRDVTERVQEEEQLLYLSTHDGLTDLYNRTFFEGEVRRLESGRVAPISVIVMDVDDLKAINDTKGHAAGDQHLKRLAVVLRQAFRAEDVAARIGGDEICVLLPSLDADACARAVERLRDELERHNEIYRGTPISISIGCATAERPLALGTAIRAADRRMYEVKRRRRRATSGG